jgi:hypothetical protein
VFFGTCDFQREVSRFSALRKAENSRFFQTKTNRKKVVILRMHKKTRIEANIAAMSPNISKREITQKILFFDMSCSPFSTKYKSFARYTVKNTGREINTKGTSNNHNLKIEITILCSLSPLSYW